MEDLKDLLIVDLSLKIQWQCSASQCQCSAMHCSFYFSLSSRLQPNQFSFVQDVQESLKFLYFFEVYAVYY